MLSACKTVPQISVPEVNPLDFLDEDSLVYIKIPVAANYDFTKKLVKLYAGGMDDKYVDSITEKLNVIYGGFSYKNKKKHFQIVADADRNFTIPVMLAKSALWSKESVETDSFRKYVKFSHTEMDLQLTQPVEGRLCVSDNADHLIQNYDGQVAAALEMAENPRKSWKESEAYSYLFESDDDSISFYMIKPLSFIANLLGAQLSSSVFQLKNVKGQVQKLANSKYAITLDLEFTSPGLVNKATGWLALALGLTNSQIVIADQTHMQIKGIQVSMTQLQSMLGF